MGLLSEALFAIRARRFVEWAFIDRPQIPILFGISFYSVLYLTYKYDLIARIQGQPAYNDYSYVKEAVKLQREKARHTAAAQKPSVDFPSSSLSSTGVN